MNYDGSAGCNVVLRVTGACGTDEVVIRYEEKSWTSENEKNRAWNAAVTATDTQPYVELFGACLRSSNQQIKLNPLVPTPVYQ